MDQSEVLRFEQQKQITKLSQAIRTGATKLRDEGCYLSGNGCGCVIAMAGIGYGLEDKWCGWRHLFDFVEEKSGYDYKFLHKIEALHICGMTGLQIADKLEVEGL